MTSNILFCLQIFCSSLFVTSTAIKSQQKFFEAVLNKEVFEKDKQLQEDFFKHGFYAASRYVQEENVEYIPSEDDTFVGATVEYGPKFKDGISLQENVLMNVDGYEAVIVKTRFNNTINSNLDIIVFPEGGLGTHVNQTWFYAEPVPEASSSITPCVQNDTNNPVLQRLSCIAKNNSLYMVVNLIESSKNTSSNLTLYYNTNVVFDRNGTVIARYRKYNVYGGFGKPISKPASPDYIYFDTDFGVRFGTFTCFDIYYETPALDLATKYNITHFVYPAGWFSELPFQTALQAQSAWAYSTNSILLAANTNRPRTGESGTGFYVGKSRGDNLANMAQFDGDFAIVGALPKTVPTGYVFVDGCLVYMFNSSDFIPDGLNLLREKMMNCGETTLVEEKTFFNNNSFPCTDEILYVLEKVNRRLCRGELCCRFSFIMIRVYVSDEIYAPPTKWGLDRGDGFGGFSYRMVALDGVRGFTAPGVTAGEQICGIVSCLDEDNVGTCGIRTSTDFYDPLTYKYNDRKYISVIAGFMNLTIEAEISGNRTRAFPNGILQGLNYALYPGCPPTFGQPLDPFVFDFSVEDKAESGKKVATLTTFESSMIISPGTVAIYVRNYDRDGSPVTTANCVNVDYQIEEPSWSRKVNNWCQEHLLSIEFLHSRLPVLRSLRRYKLSDMVYDMIAGISVGLTILPLSTAYASLAGLRTEYGLNTTLAGFIIYALLGNVRESFIGPSSVLSLITYEYTYKTEDEFVVLLTFFTGLIQLLMGIARLGFIVNYVSLPVSSGFVNAASMNIISAMIPSMLGMQVTSTSFVVRVWKIVNHISETKYKSDLPLGITAVVILVFLKALGSTNMETGTRTKKVLKSVLFFIKTSSNAIVIVCGMIVSSIFQRNTGSIPFTVVGSIREGLPRPALPPFGITLGDRTYTFLEMVDAIKYGIFIVPLMSALFTSTIVKSYYQGRKALDSTQEFIALGVCNMVGSLFGAMPASGAIILSAVAHACNVRTPLAGIYTGILSILTLEFLTKFTYLIPKATIGAVLICSVIVRIDFGFLFRMWRVDKRDVFISLLTIFLTLTVGLSLGLLVGVLVSILYLLYMWAFPNTPSQVKETVGGVKYLELTPDKGVYFPGADRIRQLVQSKQEGIDCFVVDCSRLSDLDFTAISEFNALGVSLRKHGKELAFYKASPGIATKGSVPPSNMKFCNSQADLDQFLAEINPRS